ncbi:hypothetical protein GQ54DRAFT_237580, partial [Martensiomyces pterosporus]
KRWLRNVDRLMDLLLFATHISYGQPARMSELATAKMRNTPLDMRSVYILRGTVGLITTYWKGQSLQDRRRSISRYLPKSVAAIVVQYI